MTTQTVNPGVTSFVVIRCVCGKPTNVVVPIGTPVRFTCGDKGCRRYQETVAR